VADNEPVPGRDSDIARKRALVAAMAAPDVGVDLWFAVAHYVTVDEVHAVPGTGDDALDEGHLRRAAAWARAGLVRAMWRAALVDVGAGRRVEDDDVADLRRPVRVSVELDGDM